VLSRFFTNFGDQTLLRRFQTVFEQNPDLESFDALTGLLPVTGYFAIRPLLERVPKIRILAGLDVEATTIHSPNPSSQEANPRAARKAFRDYLRQEIESAPYDREIETGIIQLMDDIILKKVALRVHPTRHLRARLYIFRPKGINEQNPGAVITGSSELTPSGLGIEAQGGGHEFNVQHHNYTDVRFATDEFERLWREAVEVPPTEIRELRETTHLSTQAAPRDLYFKLLAESLGLLLDPDPELLSGLPESFPRFACHLDAVALALGHLERHSGVIIGDVVGLGRPMTAALVAHQFCLRNGYPHHRSRILLVSPPARVGIWKEAFGASHPGEVVIASGGGLADLKSPETFDMVIVDDVHRFRNSAPEAVEALERICASPAPSFEDGAPPVRKRIILTTSAAWSLRPEETQHLVTLFQDLARPTLPVGRLQSFFAGMEHEFRQSRRDADANTARARIKAIHGRMRSKILAPIFVRRTRADLQLHDEYKDDLEKRGLFFPKIKKPRQILFPVSPALEALCDRTLGVLSNADGVGFHCWRTLSFLKPEKKELHPHADRISRQLATLARASLVQRLESSFHALRLGLRRLLDATTTAREGWMRGAVSFPVGLRPTDHIVEGREEELLAALADPADTSIPRVAIPTGDFDAALGQGFEKDWQKLNALVAEWDKVAEDPKWDEFLNRFKAELFVRGVNHEGRKLALLCQCRDTAEYLQQKLAQAGYSKVLVVHSANRADRLALVRSNFDPTAPSRSNEFEVLICDEGVAESVDIHRANVLVHYDSPWASNRLMDRIGRLHRNGESAPRVFIFNLYPTARADDEGERRKRALTRLQAFHAALGEARHWHPVEEELGAFGSAEGGAEEDECDESLGLLMELRQFRSENPDAFRRLNALPARIRIGRNNPGRVGGTLVHMRNDRREAFHRVPANGELEELTLTEAASELRPSLPDEKGISLHKQHHDHVRRARQHFEGPAVAAEPQPLSTAKEQSSRDAAEARTVAWLDALLASSTMNPASHRLIRAARQGIGLPRFQRLRRELQALESAARDGKLPMRALLGRLTGLLKRHGVDRRGAPAASRAPAATPAVASSDDCSEDSPTEIVLSVSFDQPSRA
jgi:hypothetical protein